jgi:membrane fusion protein
MNRAGPELCVIDTPINMSTVIPQQAGGFREEEVPLPLRITPPWTWSVLTFCATFVVSALIVLAVGRVEIVSRGRGVVRPTGGIRPLTAQRTGAVALIYVQSGDPTRAGDPILRIQSSEAQAATQEADGEVARARAEYQQNVAADQAFVTRQMSDLQSRAGALREQVSSHIRSVELFQGRLKTNVKLREAGLVSDLDFVAAQEGLEQAGRQLASARQALLQIEQEIASLEQRRRAELRASEQKLRAAEIRRDAIASSHRDDVIRAPLSGHVEGLVVRVGDVVANGDQVGKLIPDNAPVEVVAFLPEKDRAFVTAGDVARIEFDQYPYTHFGTRTANIIRVSNDVASPYEVREAFGQPQNLDGASHRIELHLVDDVQGARRIPVRSGMLANVRFVLRREAPLAIVFNPLRRLFSRE